MKSSQSYWTCCCIPMLLLSVYSVLIAPAIPCRAQEPAGEGATKSKDPKDGERDPVDEPARFIRLVRDDAGTPLRMEVAVVRFQAPEGGAVVDLVSAVHIGEREYYDTLNQRFADYDAVLYELVAPAGTRVPAGGGQRSGNPVSMLQDMSKDFLQLSSQLECVDYTGANFVHADMSPEAIGKAMKERGDTPFTIFLSATAEAMRQANLQAQQQQAQGNKIDVDLFSLLGDPAAPKRVKTMLAEQFAESGMLEAGLGPTLNKMLVQDRNAAAVRVLQSQLAKGKQKLAIFYGAAHMPDFQRRLKDDFGLQSQSTEWLLAWDLTKTPQGNATSPLQQLKQLLEQGP
ncbi:MAG: hypothetical protein R3E01_12485 [Pirellulaceae bacterium]|nr:hypothetical protein [Planctomycetales bacterium]